VAVLALALLLAGIGVWSWLGATGTRAVPGLAARTAESRAPEATLPRIALERLKQPPSGAAEPDGSRDVFRFGRPPAPPETPRPQPVATPPLLPVDTLPATPPPPPTLPPFGVKYIGSLEQRGTKIAVLLSDDKKEVLTAREGETVANRLRIVKIGLESVDVQDVGSDRVRKIPLKGN
jgi:hypothetical protein